MIALATYARSCTDEALIAALRARGITGTGIRDFFDLAEALLSPDSIQEGLSHQDRTRLAVLAAAAELAAPTDAAATDSGPVDYPAIAERVSVGRRTPLSADDVQGHVAALAAVLLCGTAEHGVVTFREVAARLAAWPAEGLPGAAELAAPYPPTPVAEAEVETRLIDARTAERAFSTVAAIAELVAAIGAEPARELGKGGLALPDTKRLALAMSVQLGDVASFLRIAARAGLVACENTEWTPTDAGADWLTARTSVRWRGIARAWYDAMPADVREILETARVPWGAGLRGYIAWLYPAAGPGLGARIDLFAADAELLGITAGGVAGMVGGLVLRGAITDAVDALSALLPHEVERVYLQHDLTIISPGPLAARLDARLRTLADVESRELASSYRVTAASVERGLAAGETAETMLAFLGEISLTGMPQPLGYLVTETAARYGRVRVGALRDEGPARSYVRSDDTALIGQMAVDKTLAALAFARTGEHRLLSRFEPSMVFWALHDARYPVAAENEQEEIVRVARRLPRRAAPVVRPDPLVDLVVRLRAADAEMGETGQAWLARQIEVAIREKRTLTVGVRMPGGTVSEYLLEPTSVANGRMRGRDRRADIERTLPLSSIDSIR